jgi:hypothetical protein
VGDDDERGRVHGGQKRWQPATRDPRETMFRRQGDIDSDGRRTHGSASWCPWWIRLVAKEDGAATNQPAGGPLHQAWRMGFSSRQVFATGTEVQPDIVELLEAAASPCGSLVRGKRWASSGHSTRLRRARMGARQGRRA